jgi:hypothetical protein
VEVTKSQGKELVNSMKKLGDMENRKGDCSWTYSGEAARVFQTT